MFSRIRRRFTYANVAMTLALVFAMSGGAYAASKYLITSTKQISPKVLKALKGKNGTNGVNGVNGANGVAGAQGPAGPQGAAGEKGAAGTNGTPGKDGASVTSASLAPGSKECKEGGSEFTAAASKKSYACNGSPWTAGGTLPKGSTETGAWALRSTASVAEELRTTAISFTIPLAASPSPTVTFVPASGSASPPCMGNAEKPEAESGHLCIFESGEAKFLAAIHRGGLEWKFATNPAGTLNAGTTGAELVFQTKAPTTPGEEVSAEGTWAVTG